MARLVVSSAKIYADFGATRNTIPKGKANVAILDDVFITNSAGTFTISFPISRKDCEFESIRPKSTVSVRERPSGE